MNKINPPLFPRIPNNAIVDVEVSTKSETLRIERYQVKWLNVSRTYEFTHMPKTPANTLQGSKNDKIITEERVQSLLKSKRIILVTRGDLDMLT